METKHTDTTAIKKAAAKNAPGTNSTDKKSGKDSSAAAIKKSPAK